MPFDPNNIVGLPQNQANANLQAAKNTPPKAAASALRNEAATGIPAAVGMAAPEVGEGVVQDQQNQAALDSSPALQGFVGKSPAHAAAVQDNLPGMAGLFSKVGHWIEDPAVEAFQAADTHFQKQKEAYAKGDNLGGFGFGLARLLDAGNEFWASTSIPSIINVGAHLFGKAAATVAPYAPATPHTALQGMAPGPVAPMEGILNVLTGHPFVDPGYNNPQQAQKNYIDTFNSVGNLLAMFAHGPKSTESEGSTSSSSGSNESGYTVPPETSPKPPGKGAAPIGPDGFHVVDKDGNVVDAEGNAFKFANPRDAAFWMKDNLVDTGQQFNPAGNFVRNPNGTMDGHYTIREFSRADNVEPPPPGVDEKADEVHTAIAENKIAKVQELEDEVSKNPLFLSSPDVLKEALEDAGLKGQVAYVQSDALAKAAFEEPPTNQKLMNLFIKLDSEGKVQGPETQIPVPLADYIVALAGHPAAAEIHNATTFGDTGWSLDQIKMAAANAKVKPTITPPEVPQGASPEPEKHVPLTSDDVKSGASFIDKQGYVYHIKSNALTVNSINGKNIASNVVEYSNHHKSKKAEDASTITTNEKAILDHLNKNEAVKHDPNAPVTAPAPTAAPEPPTLDHTPITPSDIKINGKAITQDGDTYHFLGKDSTGAIIGTHIPKGTENQLHLHTVFHTAADSLIHELNNLKAKIQEPIVQPKTGIPAKVKDAFENIPKLSDWKLVGPKPGGNVPGGVYTDPQGEKWLVKGTHKGNEHRIRNEVLASQLMRLAGIPAPEMKFIDLGTEHGGGLGLASKWKDVTKLDLKNPQDVKDFQDQFAVHAWLGNRDVVGMANEPNTGRQEGKVTNFDPGGAMVFRGANGLKAEFDHEASEFETMRTISQSGKPWFGKMTDDELKASVDKYLVKMSPNDIKTLVDASGMLSRFSDLLQALIDRRQAIIDKVGSVSAPVDTLQYNAADAPVIQSLAAKVDTAVQKVAQERGLDKIFTKPAAIGMTKARYNLHAKNVDKFLAELKQRTFDKLLETMRKNYKKAWQAEYAKHSAEATNFILDTPLMKAQHSLRFTVKGENTELTKDNAFAPGGKPITFYHKTVDKTIGATPEELKLMGMEKAPLNPKFKVKNYQGISVSMNPKFVEDWGASGEHTEIDPWNNAEVKNSWIAVVHLKAKSVGDFRNPADVKKAAEWYKQQGHSYYTEANLATGAYGPWENPRMLKDLGWEGIYMLETAYDKYSTPATPNAFVLSGDQVYFKYRSEGDSVKLKIHTDEKANYKDLVDKLPNNIWGKDGVTADQVASQFGFQSGQEMLEAMAQQQQEIGDTGFRKYVNDQIKAETERRTEASVGKLLDPDVIRQAAEAAFTEKPITDLLVDQLKSMLAPGAKVDVGMIQGLAFEKFMTWESSEALKIKNLEKRMKNQGEKVEDALLKGRADLAIQAKQTQLEAHYQLQFAHTFKKTWDSTQALMRKLGTLSSIESRDPDMMAVIQKAIQNLGLHISRDPEELERYLADPDHQFSSIQDAVNYLALWGKPVKLATIPSQLAASVANKEGDITKLLSVSDFIDHANMIKAMAGEAAERGKVIVGYKEAEIADIANETVQNAEFIGGGRTDQELLDLSREAYHTLRDGIRTYFVDNLRFEIYAHYMDRDRQGLLMEYGVNPLHKASGEEIETTKQFLDTVKDFPEFKEVSQGTKNLISAPDHMKSPTPDGEGAHYIKDRGNLIVAALHLGSPSAFRKMSEGFKWQDPTAAEDWILHNLTPGEETFIKKYWEFQDTHFPLLDKMHNRVYGYGLVKDVKREVNFIHSGTHEGGYLPIKYNPLGVQMSGAMKKAARREGAQVGTQSHPVSMLPSSGYSEVRTDYDDPVDLNWNSLAARTSESIHDLTHREALISAQKVFTDPQIIHAFTRILGPEYSKQALPWLQYIAQNKMLYDPATAAAATAVRQVANNLAWAHIAYQLSSMTKHSLVGVGHIIGEAQFDVAGLSKAMLDLFGLGDRNRNWNQFVLDNSYHIRNAQYSLDSSLYDTAGEHGFDVSAAAKYKELGTFLFTVSKALEARLTWLHSYRRALVEYGSHEKAVDAAEMSVRNTQGAGAPVDQPPLFRKGESWGQVVGQQLTRFMSLRSATTNRLWTAGQQIGLAARLHARGEDTLAAKYAKTAGLSVLGFTVFVTILMTLYDQIRGVGDPKKNALQNTLEDFGWNLVENGPGSLVGVSQAIDAVHYSGKKAGDVMDIIDRAKGDKLDPNTYMRKGELRKISNLVLPWMPQPVPDSVGTEAQNIYDAFHTGDLQQNENSPAAWMQRVLLTRGAHYSHEQPARTRR